MSIFFPSSIELSIDDHKNIYSISQESAKYKSLPSRYNPFLDEYIIPTIENNVYSLFLKKNITNVEDAAWHAKYLTEAWAKEDIEEKIERRRLQNRTYQRTFQLNKKQEISPEVKEAYNQWKAAIVQRKAAMDQWDVYITHLHKAYLTIKLNSANEEERNDQTN